MGNVRSTFESMAQDTSRAGPVTEFLLLAAYFKEAISMTKRYFTSPLSSRS